ncbi:glycoside hydrolase family 3 protein [uncultured Dysosmobacter sp.]|uniref:glycoside hydrolase family 3 protein n=1 Tax=uncultured Dysosmobacter sp. TaxID=2591384 RepID=UPI00260234E7|nr:glycoside hydrolase family 3 N-terminal domain-containing protein [uncultured Dysosmobacter sp.]
MSALDLSATPFELTDAQCQWVTDTLAAMTDEEKAGQLFCVMGGDYPIEDLKRMTERGLVGGVLYRPVRPASEIQADFEILDSVSKIPLLHAANLEEGGSGGASDGTLFGWPMLTAATDDPAWAETFGALCASEGTMAGINWTFSPVSDLDLNYLNPITNVRTFGSDLKRVKAMTAAYVRAVQSRGIAACAKHFPGDGVDYRDHHLHPTVNSLPAEKWYSTYGEVYKNLIAAGLMSVMVGHIAQPNVARDICPGLSTEEALLPGSLSRTLLTGVLRERLGFNGLITTDATIMGGYTQPQRRCEAIPASVMAGCDMLVFTTDLVEDYGYILKALADGRLTHERLDEAVARILALKAKVCFEKHHIEPVDGPALHRACADKAITLVKSTYPSALPMTPERYPNIRLITLGKDNILDGSIGEITRSYLIKQGFTVERYDPFTDNLHGTAELPQNRLTLYLANYEQASNQTVVRINWCPKHALDMPRFVHDETSIFVSLANPYCLQDVPRVQTYINAYTATRDTIELSIDKLMGKSTFTGSSPVDAFCGLPDTKL